MEVPSSPSPGLEPGGFLGRLQLPRWLRVLRPPKSPPFPGTPEPETTKADSALAPDWNALIDVAFQAGYDGRSAETVFAAIHEAGVQSVAAVRAHTARGLVAARAEFQALCGQLRQSSAEATKVREEIRDAAVDARAAATRLHERKASLLDAHARLASERARYGVRTIVERAQAEAELVEQVGAAVQAADRARSASEESILQTELKRRTSAGPELQRWAEHQEAHAELLRRQCDQQGRVVEILRGSGMTQRVAGFLVWAGYLGMAAFGWRMGEVLHAQTTQAGADGLVQFLIARSFSVFRAIGPNASLGWLAALSFLALVVVPAIILAYDWVLTRFDGRWNPARGTTDGRTGKSRRRGIDGDAESRAADLTWDSVVSTLHGRVDRSDYRKHLARLPLLALPVVLSLIALVFLSLSGQPLPAQQLPLNSLMFLFVGVAAAALGTGLVCIALGAGLRRRLASDAVPPVPFWPLAGPLVVVLGWEAARIAGWVKDGAWGQSSLAGPACLLLANAVMLAHGLVYRNLYRDWTALRRIVTEAEEKVRRLQPHSLLTPQDLAPVALHRRWTDLYQRLDEVWKAQDDGPGVPLGADPPAGEAEPPARDLLLDGTEVTRQDGRMAPALASEVLRCRVEYVGARDDATDIARRLHALRTRLGEIEGDALSRRLRDLRYQIAQVRAHGNETRAAVAARFVQLRFDAESAYHTGELLRERERVIRADPALARFSTQVNP